MALRKFGQLGGSYDPREEAEKRKREEEEEQRRREQAYHDYVRATSALGVDPTALQRKRDAQAYDKALDTAIERARQAEAARRDYTQALDSIILPRQAGSGTAREAVLGQRLRQIARERAAEEYAASDPRRKYREELLKLPTQERTQTGSLLDSMPQRKTTQLLDSMPKREDVEFTPAPSKSTLQADLAARRTERDNLLKRYSQARDQLDNAATPDRYLDAASEMRSVYDEADKRGGIDNLYRLQQADAAQDRRYGALLRGVDPSKMSFLEKAGTVAGGMAAGAAKQSAAGAVGLYQSAREGAILNADEGMGTGVDRAVNSYLGALSDDPDGEGTKAMRNAVQEAAKLYGGDDYARKVLAAIDSHVAEVRQANPDRQRGLFSEYISGLDLNSIERDDEATFRKLNDLAHSDDVYQTMFNLQDSAAADIQRGKDVMQSDLGDIIMDAGTSAIQSGVDALLGLPLGAGTPFAMAPFALRAYGGAYGEAARNVMQRGEEIGKEMAKNISKYAGTSAAIEVGTEMLWGTVGAMGGVTGGGALDDVITNKLTGALSRMAQTEKGAKILSFLGEKVLGGTFEGIEEVISDAANYILDTAGMYGGDRGTVDELLKNMGTSFATGAMSGLMGDVSRVVTGPMQNAMAGRDIRRNDPGMISDLIESAQEGGELGDAWEKIAGRRGIEDVDALGPQELADSLTNRDIGKLYQIYEDMTASEDYDDIERAVDRLEKGKELTDNDVARIMRNKNVSEYLSGTTGVEISTSADAIEALKALASQREASQGAQAENVSQTEETAPTGESEARPEFGRGLNYTRSAEDTARAMTEMAQPMSPAESIRMQTGEEARAARFEDLAFRKYSKVADALERLNVDSDSAAEIVQAYQPGQNEVEYAGEAARFINQGEEGRDFDYEAAGENPTMSLAQARVAYTAGRAKYNTNINEEAENGTEAETGEVRVRDGLQGNDGAGTGVEAGRVERGTGSAEFREEIAGFRGGRRVSGVRSESVSASDLGIRNGTTRKNIRILQKNSKGVYADKYIEQAREEVEARGYMYVPFVGGSLEIESISKNGKKVIVQSRGYFDPETKTIYVRADHQIFTADQIARHELMHETLSREYNDSSREEVLSKYRDRMIEDLGSVDKLEDVLRDYYALYKGTELSNEDVFEEMICDAAGNMNEFIMHGHMEDAAKAAPVLKAAKKATVSARTEGGKDNNSSAPKYSAELKAPASFTLSKDTAEETEKNIQSGKSALNELIEKAKTSDSPESLSVKNAMSRKELGNIDFVWGNPGKGASFKHGYGFSHIISKRNSEGGDGVRTAYEIVNVIANATNGDVQKNDFSGMGNKRIRLYDNGYTVVLSQNSGANSWVLSGWENEQTDASASGEVRDSSGATAAKPIRTRLSGGNASVSSVDTVAEENPGVKKKNSRDLGVYLQETHEEYKTDKENLTIAEQGIEDLLDGLERISAAGGEVDLGRQGRDGKTDIRTLGNGISAQFIKTGRVNLNGTKIRNAEDLAQLCQIFRNPRFETVRYFYVKKGKIVGTDSVTCRLPGLSLTYSEDFQSNDLIKKIKRVGADGVYLMHNHPSGHVNPSTDDINATGTIAETVQKNTGAKLLGHIIIDHRVFTELQADTKNRTVSKEEKEIPGQMQLDFLLMPSQENRNLGKDVYSPETVAAVGRDIVSGKGYSAIVYASQKGQVRQIQEVSDKALLNNKQLVNYIRNQRVNIGAGMAFVYTQNDDVYKAMGNAYVNDILTDVILDGPEMLLDMRSGTRQREGVYMGLNVSLKDAVHANEEQSPYSDVESKYDRYLMPDSDLTQEEIKAKKDYRTYLMPEAKEWYSKSARFKNWAHRDLAYISAASVAGAKIPYEILKTIPEIVKAEERARGSKGDSWSKNLPGTNAEVDARRDRLVEKLLDDEHGSAAWDEGKNKIKKVNGKEQFTGPVARNREAYIVIGRPAGGKSRVFANPLSHEHQARIIDSDVVKPWLDGFDDGYGAGYVQKESAKIADKALQMAIARGENVVIPRVGGKSVISDVVETLKEYGYTVNLYYNEVSEDSSIMRAASRFAEEGRFLSLDYLTTIGNKADKTFRDYAENKDYFDYAEWRNNDVEFGKEPTETWNSRMEQTIRERLADQGLYGDRRRGNEQRGNAEGNREDSEGASRTAELKTSRELSTGELYEANRQLRKDLTELRSKLKTRTEQRDYWKGQTKLTEGRRVRLDDAKKLARVIASEYGTKVDADVVGAKMKDLAEFCLNEREFDDEFYGEARTKAYEIAHIILDNAEILRSEGDPASYEKLRDYLRTTKLYVPGNMQHDLAEDYQAFRKSLLGTVTLTTSDTSATGIDKAYKELQGIFGEGLFPDIAHPADQLKRMLEILESFRPIYERMNNYEMADAVEWTANDILGRVVGEEIRQTDPTYADKMEARLKAEREKAKAALKLVRQKRDQQVEALKQHYRQMEEDKRAKRIDSEARTRLLNIARRLNNKKLDRATRALLDKYIGDLDLVSKGLTGKSVHDLQGLQTWYDAYKEKMGEAFIPIKSIEDRLKRLSQKHIKDMTQEEVADLTTILLHLENEIRTASKLIESQEKRDIYAAGMEVIDDIRGTRGKHGALDKYIVTETLSPVREIRRLTGYREHDPLYTATKELADGQRKMLDYQRRAEALLTKWTQDKAFTKRIAGKHAEEITVQGLVNGEMTDVKITPAMRMALYLHAKNDGNMKHISKGGVKIPDMALYKKGKMQEAYDQGVRVVFNRSQINQIASQMTEGERAFADAVSWYYNNMSRDEINETSELLKGFSIAGVDYYYPIDTDGNFLKKEFDAIKRDGSIEGMGFLKERIDNPTNPIMLYDMNDTLNKSISQHSKYVGLAIPVRNFNKLYGVSTFSERDMNYEADPFDRQDWQYDTSVAETVRQKWGAQAAKYIEKMMTDIQNGTGLDRDVWGTALAKARSKYAGAVLNTNASVAFKQTASYPTAAAVVGYAPLMKALKDSNRKVDLDKVANLTSLLWYRMKGFSNVELGDIGKGKHQIPKALNWIQGMDTWTTRKLWLAAEYYVEANNKGLKRGTEAFDLSTAEIYNRIIEETQPNYTMMQRPQILRSDNDMTRALNMFKTQPFQNFNILYDAIGNLRAQERYYKANATEENLKALKEARKGAARAISSQIISAFVFSLMQFAWDAFRGKTKKYKDDDEDEITLLSWLKGMGINVLSSVGGMVPLGGFALELGEVLVDGVSKALGGGEVFGQKFYGISENATESVNSMGKALVNIVNRSATMLKNESVSETDIRKLVENASDIAQFAGAPVSNWIKMAQSVARNVFLAAEKDKYIGEYMALRVTTDPASYKSEYYDLLHKAWKNDPASYEKLYDKMVDEKGFETESNSAKANIDASIKKWGYALLEDTWRNRPGELESIKNKLINMHGDPFATDKNTAAENINAKLKKLEQENMNSGGNNDTFYNRVYDGITGTSLWASASAEAQGKALDQLLSMALAETDPGYDKNGAKKLEKARGGASVGLDETEYTLFLLAMSMANPDGGNIKNSELEEAINMIPGLTPEEQSYLWGSEKGNHANDPYLTPNVTRGGSMTPELAPTSNAPAWYHPKKYHEPSGQAGDVVKRGEGLNENPYMLSMTGRPTRARIDFESKLGGDVYRKLWSMAQEQNAIYDVYNTMEYIASDRQDQLYGRGNTDSPVERLTAALAYMHDYEQDPAKKKLITKLYEILADGVENGDLSRKDSELNKLLWKLGF